MSHQTKLDNVEIGYDELGIQNKIYIFIGFYRFYATAYSASFASSQDKPLVVLAKSGVDDYVVKVVDVYMS